MKKMPLILLPFIVVAVCGRLFAHGLFHELRQDGAVTVHLKNQDGVPARNVPVKVYAPGNDKDEYQSGKTDKNGTFSFRPDSAGEWKLRVGDNAGRAITINTLIGDTVLLARGGESRGSEQGHAMPWWQQLLMAAAIIWGFMGFFLFFQNRRFGGGHDGR